MPEKIKDPQISVPVIFGTAGHIDHGKTLLIKALTGTDTDRLKEEKQRGITIELGYAFLNDKIAFIDVPGHEKFVRQMVAGAATVDYALLVVAADDGVMPQTREHLDILNLLNVKDGIIVITKADLVDQEFIQLVREDIREVVQGSVMASAPILVADSISGRGIGEVRKAIVEMSAHKRIQGGLSNLRIPIDRVFSLKGFGTIVTGSVVSGKISAGQTVELLPSQKQLRVKGLQSQGSPVENAVAGQRVAVNLANVGVADLSRGDVVASEGWLHPSELLHVKIEVLSNSEIPIKHRQRVHVHMGTADLVARVLLLENQPIESGNNGFAQLKLESAVACQRLDRFILRRFSPLTTIGGGIVLDANPKVRVRKAVLRQRLSGLDTSDARGLILAIIEKSPYSSIQEVASMASQSLDDVTRVLQDLLSSGELYQMEIKKGKVFCSADYCQKEVANIQAILGDFHTASPLKAGMNRSELVSKISSRNSKEIAKGWVGLSLQHGFVLERVPGIVSHPDFVVDLSQVQRSQVEELIELLNESKLTPPSIDSLAGQLSISKNECRMLLDYLKDTGRAVCVDGDLFFSQQSLDNARQKLIDLFKQNEAQTVSEIRQVFDSTRKYIIPLLGHFDSLGWTRRKDQLRFAGPKLLPTNLEDRST